MTAVIKVSLALQEIAEELTVRLDNVAGVAVGWSLFVWTEGTANYIARAERAKVIPVLEL